ncbi:MAG: protein kinase [Gemmatimonadaceae bacterium]
MTFFEQQLAAGLEGRYVIERPLGEGGMALVFLARDVRHDRKVALKVLRPEISADIGAERFLREIRMAAGLTHPHILPVYDSGSADGLLFYTMPSMEGNTLRHRMQRETQMPIAEAIRITREVASALDYAHRHGVLHRDVKPENVLLHESNAMVADFGIGKALGSGESITRTGMSMGTPAYMSPEQASGDSAVDGRSDLYSLGCVLYEMLTGEPPFTGPNAQVIIAKRFMTPVPRVSVSRDVSPALEAAVTKALGRAPADRHSSLGEFAEALKNIGKEADTTSFQRTPPESPRGPVTPKAIAVLPFSNMSADPENEYFSDGMTEEIINALAKVPGLQVASRSSCFAFKGKQVDIREVGEKLGVGAVLEGSVRKVGSKIRITAQLINVENGYHMWSETYNRQLEDVFEIQDELSRAIVEALKLRLASDGDALVVPAKNIEAYNLYLKARFFYHRFTEASLRKSLDAYERVLRLEPSYARAYAGMADCWCRLADDWMAPDDAYPRAKTAATRALEHDPQLADAYTSLGKVLGWYEWRFEDAEKQLRRAVALGPQYAEGHFAFGSILPAVGLLGEAIVEMRKALALDPLDPGFSRWVVRFLLFSGAYGDAIAQGEKTIELGEDFSFAYLDMGSAYLGQGDYTRALDWYRKGQALEGSVRSYDALIVRALVPLDRREEAEEILARLEEESKQNYVRSEIMAMGYAALGNIDRAFELLERAYQTRSGGLIYFDVDPGYGPLRGDPRFADLKRRIGLK